jgi:hypothetical protein
MEENTPLEDIGDKLKTYVDTRFELVTLKGAEKISNIGSSIGMALSVGLLFVFFLLFISIAGGFYLSMLLESYTYGFLVLSGIYLLVMIIVYLGRDSMLINPIRNILIREMFEDKKK